METSSVHTVHAEACNALNALTNVSDPIMRRKVGLIVLSLRKAPEPTLAAVTREAIDFVWGIYQTMGYDYTLLDDETRALRQDKATQDGIVRIHPDKQQKRQEQGPATREAVRKLLALADALIAAE